MTERLSTDDLARREAPAPDEPDDLVVDDDTGAPDPSDADVVPEPELLDAAQSRELGERWSEIQTGFVDEPRRAVQEADALVADLMQRLAESFSRERQTLEGQWDRGDDVSTEDLRVALQRYRSFFDRLLAV